MPAYMLRGRISAACQQRMGFKPGLLRSKANRGILLKPCRHPDRCRALKIDRRRKPAADSDRGPIVRGNRKISGHDRGVVRIESDAEPQRWVSDARLLLILRSKI